MSLVAASAAGAGGWAAWEVPALRLQALVISGETEHLTTTDQLFETADIARGQHLLMLSTDRIAGRLSTLPWVDSVTVERILPSKLKLTFKERTADAVVVMGNSRFLVDSDGRVLERGQAPLVRIFDLPVEQLAPGAEIASREFSHAIDVLQQMPQRLRERVASMSAAKVDSVGIVLNDGVQILFGAAEKMEEKLFAAQALLDRYAASGQAVERIDVRVPSRPAVLPAQTG